MKISVVQREKKIRKNSSRRWTQIENADGRREKTCAIVQNFVEG
jgi:hypothetical protein